MEKTRTPAHVIAQDDAFCLARWYDTGLSVYRGAATVAHVQQTIALCEQMLRDSSKRITFVSIIERTSPAPAESTRRQLASWSSNQVPRMAAAVLVAEGGGFRGALVRGVGVALTALAPHKVPFKFASTVVEAGDLLAPHISSAHGGALELRLAIAELRAGWR